MGGGSGGKMGGRPHLGMKICMGKYVFDNVVMSFSGHAFAGNSREE